nr:unnamed protein product [Callosobruchus analis]
MNSLLNYGSDDDLDDSSDERSTPDSNDESKSASTERGGRHSPKPREDRRYRDRGGDRDRNTEREKEEDRNGRSSKEEDSRDRGRSRLSDSRGRDRDNRDRYRDSDRDRDRRDRDRRRSKSPRDSDRLRSRSRSPRRDRSRSNSREKMPRKFPYKRFERGANREKFERMGFEPKKTDNFDPLTASSDDQKDRFFVPGITGRFRDQIEKRKLLWQKKEDDAPKQGPSKETPVATKVWEATTFAQDTDGEGSKPASEVLKKQEEMFSSMEQQYEVARTTTHTMRGVGLGFGSYQR